MNKFAENWEAAKRLYNLNPKITVREISDTLKVNLSLAGGLQHACKNIGLITGIDPVDNAKKDGSVVIAIGDLHEPFSLDKYLDHCVRVQQQYAADTVLFVGDIIDNHYPSYHESDPDGMGGKKELRIAKERLKRWYEAFPDAIVMLGNHDRMVMRKAQSSAIPSEWIKAYQDVLEVPDWHFMDRVVIDEVQYIHGEGGQARTRHRKDLMSTVQGHWHAQSYTEWTVGTRARIFGCQVGCGINHETYAMAYAKNFPKPAIGCAVVKYGIHCYNEMMVLGGNQ